MSFLCDVLVHTWDLARATGLDETLDADAVHDMLARLNSLDDIRRASGQYGPRVAVPADAAEQTRLIAFTAPKPHVRPPATASPCLRLPLPTRPPGNYEHHDLRLQY